ncbi:MAG: hypothetical protein J0H63_09490 [Rhizobiales bacterium]|nr:hypothetical protein [Hyphomicrobiales bacterium]
MARDPQLTSRMGENARRACEDFYDKSIAIQGWASMLRGLSVTKEMPSAVEEDQTFRPEIADTVLTE